MKKITLIVFFVAFIMQSTFAWSWPQCRNYNGGSPEQPATIYLGDNGNFGCDSWDMVDGKWPKWCVVISTNADLATGALIGAWSSYSNVQYKTNTSPRFTSIGTWYWGMKVEYTDAGATTGWYCNNNTVWANMYGSPTSNLTLNVSALSDPTSPTATASSITQLNLSWNQWNSKNVMIVRRLTSTAASNAPTQGTTYTVGTTLGTGTVVYNSSGTSFNDNGLTPSTGYTYTFYSENFSYYSSGATTSATTTTQTSAVNDYFRSKTTGNWNTAGTWESSPNNANWITSTLVPDASAAAITVLSGHNVTLDTNATISGLSINSGGTFTASDATARTLTISKSASGSTTTLTNNGTWVNGAGGSTVIFTGAPGSGDAIHAITGTIGFQNITVNKTGGSSNVGAAFGSGSTINGTLEIGAGGFISTAPPSSFYNTNAILKFNQGSGSTYEVNSGDFSWSISVIPNYITISSGTVNLNDDRTATGSLVIDGGTLNITNSKNLTIQKDWTRSSGSFSAGTGTVTLSGTNDGTVNVTGGATMNNLIISKTAGAKAILSSNLTTTTLTINAAAELTLNSGSSLTATTFTINSSASGTGTFVDLNAAGGLTVNGTTSVNQYLSTNRNWYISSPISGAASDIFAASVSYPLYYYVESNPNVWSQITNTSTSLGAAMTGYIANINSDRNITFTGTGQILYNGGQSISGLTRQESSFRGFNLIGNPYVSYYDWDHATLTNVSSSIWYRSKSTGTYLFQTYNSLGGYGTNGGTKYIPPMQAFWVQVTSGTGTVAFANAYRSHQDQSVATNRLKVPSSGLSTQQMLRLNVSNGINTDETILYSNPAASNNFDGYDSQKMSNTDITIPEIYTLAGTEALAINGFNTIPLDTEIPLGFTTGQAGAFSLKASQISNVDSSIGIYLKDNNDLVKTPVQLTVDGAYTFSSDISTNNTSRFTVIFKTAGATTALNTSADNQKILIYKNDNQITINCSESGNIATIYNSIGQKVTSKALTDRISVITTPMLSGVYFVNVKGNGCETTKKIILN